MSEKLRCLVYSDSPTAPTGFGTVVRNIFGPLAEEGYFADVAFFGVNYYGEPHDLPLKVWPAQIACGDRDLYGRARFAGSVLQPNNWDFDVLFFLQDHFTLAGLIQFPDGATEPFVPGLLRRLKAQVAAGQRKPFKSVMYIPVDSDMLRPEWLMWIPQLVDYPVAYLEFARLLMVDLVPALDDKLRVIPHGTNPETFFPLPREMVDERRANIAELKLKPSDPLIINVNRNQPRKDVPRTLYVFKRVLEEFPDAKLYLHMNVRDSMGFDLEAIRLNLRIPSGCVVYPGNFSEGRGIPADALNLIYNMGDVYITTARGEGFGLAVTESMCAGTPVVAPDHTSYSELLDDGRGMLVPPLPCRETMVCDNDQFRPVADVEAMAEAVIELLHNRELREGMATMAQQWARGMSWKDAVVPMWKQVFEECRAALYPAPQVNITYNAPTPIELLRPKPRHNNSVFGAAA